MAPELLTLRDLRVQTLKERREGRLTKIPNSFYKQIRNLENQIRKVIDTSKGDVKRLEKSNKKIPIFFSSSIHAEKYSLFQ